MEIYQTKTYAPESPQPVPAHLDSNRSTSPVGTWNSRMHHNNSSTREVDRGRVRQDGPNSGELTIYFKIDKVLQKFIHIFGVNGFL